MEVLAVVKEVNGKEWHVVVAESPSQLEKTTRFVFGDPGMDEAGHQRT
jgi:hypothetical protein